MASTLGPQSVEKFVSIPAPTTARGVIALSVTTTPARFAIPTSIAGKVVCMTVVGGAANLLCGTSTVSCTYGQASTVSTEAITVNAATGAHLADGVPRQFLMPRADQDTHFSVDASATAVLYIEPGL